LKTEPASENLENIPAHSGIQKNAGIEEPRSPDEPGSLARLVGKLKSSRNGEDAR